MKTVLLAEDDNNDRYFMKRACKGSEIPHQLNIVNDGQATIDYLSGTGVYADRTLHPFPAIVFLDVKLPLLDGFEVLEWIRGQKELLHLPVLMLTDSGEPSDIKRAHALGVTSYLVKNRDPLEFCESIRFILKYWLVMNRTPE